MCEGMQAGLACISFCCARILLGAYFIAGDRTIRPGTPICWLRGAGLSTLCLIEAGRWGVGRAGFNGIAVGITGDGDRRACPFCE